jgi:glycosyltransferase involved in cell wall biosynthesis
LERTAVIIPALNEAGNIGGLVEECLALGVAEVIVVDNGSVDGTGDVALEAGARVIEEGRQGYGFACAAGAAAATAEFLVFLDGDYSSLPGEMGRLVMPLVEGTADLVLGSRFLGEIAPGSMPPHQRFGNWLASSLMRLLYRVPVSDLGPYRAIRADLVRQLEMKEMTFGWPTEMMVKTARKEYKMVEVPVSHHSRRSGKSKVSGTIRGSVLAAWFILGVTVRYSVIRNA